MSRFFWQGVLPYNQMPRDRIRLVCLGPLCRLTGCVGEELGQQEGSGGCGRMTSDYEKGEG